MTKSEIFLVECIRAHTLREDIAGRRFNLRCGPGERYRVERAAVRLRRAGGAGGWRSWPVP